MSLSHFTLKREQPARYTCQLLNMGLYRKYQSKLHTLALMLFEEPLKRRADYTLVAVTIPALVMEPSFSRSAGFPRALHCF